VNPEYFICLSLLLITRTGTLVVTHLEAPPPQDSGVAAGEADSNLECSYFDKQFFFYWFW
jgi:hypothetical protein